MNSRKVKGSGRPRQKNLMCLKAVTMTARHF